MNRALQLIYFFLGLALLQVSLATTANAQSFSCISAETSLHPESMLSEERLRITITNHCTNLTIRVAACIQRKDGSWSSGSMTLPPNGTDYHESYKPLTETSYNVIWRSDRGWPKGAECRVAASGPVGSGPPVMDVPDFKLKASLTSFEKGLYKCPGAATGAFHLNQAKPGVFKMTNGSDLAQINARSLFSVSGNDTEVVDKVIGHFDGGIKTVCDGAEMPKSVKKDIYQSIAKWLIEKADQCDKSDSPASECETYRRRAAATGVRG